MSGVTKEGSLGFIQTVCCGMYVFRKYVIILLNSSKAVLTSMQVCIPGR